MTEPLTRILLIGADSADPRLIERWGAKGDLPNLMALRARSSWGAVEPPPGIDAGSVWPTFHSGLNPGRQPQFDGMRYFDSERYEFSFYPREKAAPTLWQNLSRSGKRSFVMDAPFVHLDPAINGVQIVDWGAHDSATGDGIMEFNAIPHEAADELVQLIGHDPAHGLMCDAYLPETIDDYREFLAIHLDRIAKKAVAAKHFLAKGRWDYFETVFCDVHCIGHHLWHINDANHPRYRADFEQALGQPLRDAYRALDKAVGEILSMVDERTVTIFFASHGIGPQYTGTGLLDRILYNLEHGIRTSGDGRTLKGRLRAIWRSIPPDMRAKVMPLKKNFDGALRHELFLPHREQRLFFEVYATNGAGGVRLNLKGREAQGRVDPADYDNVLNALCNDLTEITNAETGEPLIEDVIKIRERFSGPYVDGLPDLALIWNRKHPIAQVSSPKIGTLFQEYADARTGDHTAGGVFFAAGEGIAPGPLNHPIAAADFVPTFNVLLGLPQGDSDGIAIRPVVAARKTPVEA